MTFRRPISHCEMGKWWLNSNFVVRFQISFELLLSYNPIYYLDHTNPDLLELLFGGLFPTVQGLYFDHIFIRSQ